MQSIANPIIIILLMMLFSPVVGETAPVGNNGHVIVKPDVCSHDDVFKSQTLDVQCLLILSSSTMIQYITNNKHSDGSLHIPDEPATIKEKPPRHIHNV
jgi:hypothetical protein